MVCVHVLDMTGFARVCAWELPTAVPGIDCAAFIHDSLSNKKAKAGRLRQLQTGPRSTS